MKDQDKNRDELVRELGELRARVSHLSQMEREFDEAKRMLQECEGRHSSLLDSSPDPMVVYDDNGSTLYVNPAFTNTFGWTSQEVFGQRIDYVPEGRESEARETLARLFEGERVPSFETKRRTKNGKVLDIHISSSLFRDRKGKPAGHIVTLRDITEKKRAEQLLRASEEEFRSLFESAADSIHILDTHGTILRTNPATFVTSGYSEEELIGHPLSKFLTAESQRLFDERLPTLTTNGVHRQELEFVCKDGEIATVDCSTSSNRDKNGNTISIVVVQRDITERKRTEGRMRKINSLHERLLGPDDLNEKLQSVADGVVEIFDADFCRVWLTKPGDRCDAGCARAQSAEGIPACANQGPCLHLVASSGRYTHSNGEMFGRVPLGCYKIGRVAAGTDTKFLTNDIQNDPFVYDREWAGQLGLVSFAGYRLVATDGETAGVLAIFARHPISSEEDVLLEGLANSAGQVIQAALMTEALKDSQGRLQTLFDSVDDFLFVLDHKGRIMEVNMAVPNRLGFSREELSGMHMAQLHPTEQRERGEKILADLAAGLTSEYPIPLMAKDGTLIPVETKVTRGRWAGKGVLFGISRDVTEREEREEAIQASRKHLEKAEREARQAKEEWEKTFDAVPDLIMILDTSHRIVRLNKAMVQRLGIERREVIGMKCYEALHGSSSPPSYCPHAQLLGDHSEHYVESFEERLGGTFHISTSPLFGSYGELIGCVHVARDITRQKEVREYLEAERAQLLSIFDGIDQVIYVADTETYEVLYMNKYGKKLLGKDPVGGLCYEEFQHIDSPCDFCTNKIILDDKDKPYTWEHRNLFLSNDYLVTDRIIRWPDGRDVRFEIAIDITDQKRAEEAVRKSEAQYRFLTEKMNDIVWTIDLDMNTTYVSPSVEKVLGYTPEERMKQTVAEQITPESYELARTLLTSELRYDRKPGADPGRSRTLEMDYWRKDGSIACLETVLSFVRDENGQPIGIYGLSRDITERKAAENAREEGEKVLRNVLATCPIGIDHASDRRVLWANEAWEAMFGFRNKKEYVDQSERMLYMSEAEYRKAGEILYEKLETGVVNEIDAKCRRRDGSVFDCNIRVAALDPSRLEKGVISTMSDITETKQTEEALRKSEERYRSLFQDSIAPIFVTEVDGGIVDANPACGDLFGYTVEELTGINILTLYANPADRSDFRHDVERAGYVRDYPQTFRRRDGKHIECLTQASVQKSEDGTVVGYRGTLRDVTEQKTLHRQLLEAQKMEAVGTLAGGVAHDFNNLLQVVLGYSEMLMADKDRDWPGYEGLQAIQSAAERGADLVYRILTFSRRVDTKIQPIQLNEQVKQAERLLYRTIPKMIEIRSHLAKDLKSIKADSSQVEQILLNLAVNAKDAMPEGGTLVFETENVSLDEEFCTTHLDAKPGEYARLTVSDTGCGIEKDTVGHIFEPFFTTKKLGEGTGLGLSMVFGIVKMHGGHITCDSEPGKGTTFNVYFPVAETIQELDASNSQVMPAFGTETLLVVDDEDLVRELGRKILTRAGYTVLTAASGNEALEIYRNEGSTISLVILDLIMPEMGGRQCLEKLLQLDPQVKVLIASGFAVDPDTKILLQEETKGTVSKPFKIKDLLRSVRSALDRR